MNKSILKTKIRKIILEEDPMDIYSIEDNNIDEYDREVEMIIDRIELCHNFYELRDMLSNILQVHIDDFSLEQKKRYERIADKVWKLIMEDNPKL